MKENSPINDALSTLYVIFIFTVSFLANVKLRKNYKIILFSDIKS